VTTVISLATVFAGLLQTWHTSSKWGEVPILHLSVSCVYGRSFLFFALWR